MKATIQYRCEQRLFYRRENPYNIPNEKIMNLNVFLYHGVTTQGAINFEPWY